MAMGVASEVSQYIFELQKEKPNKKETRKEQTCPKRKKPAPHFQTLCLPHFL
jgi:hypothetical protein